MKSSFLAYPGDETLLDRFEKEGPFIAVHAVCGTAVVLGRGTGRDSFVEQHCTADAVPVYRRRGGGGTVLLNTGVLVVGACIDFRWQTAVDRALFEFVDRLAEAFQLVWAGQTFTRRGFGDLALGNRKVLGSSVYIQRDRMLYQGSLLVGLGAPLLERYLTHPEREPEYRAGRSHDAFVTTLEPQGTQVTPKLLERTKAALEETFDLPVLVIDPVRL